MSKHPIIANRTAFLVIGCLEAAWAPLVPYVKRAFSLDEASLGLLMLCTGLGSIIALPLSSWLCVRFGAKRVVYFSGFLMAFSLLTISLLANFTLTAIMLLVFGGCTITIDVAANVNGVAVEGQTGKHLMSGFHGGVFTWYAHRCRCDEFSFRIRNNPYVVGRNIYDIGIGCDDGRMP